MIMGALIASGGLTVSVVVVAVIFRWLILLQRRVGDHAERIARLEGRCDNRKDDQ